jgi:hypothetical protein
MKVLVTGAGGNLGRVMIPALADAGHISDWWTPAPWRPSTSSLEALHPADHEPAGDAAGLSRSGDSRRQTRSADMMLPAQEMLA